MNRQQERYTMRSMSRRQFLAHGVPGGVGAAVGMPGLFASGTRALYAGDANGPIAIDVGRQLFVDDLLVADT
jgi:hypothetical protein